MSKSQNNESKREYIVQYVIAKSIKEQEKALERIKSTGCWILNI